LAITAGNQNLSYVRTDNQLPASGNCHNLFQSYVHTQFPKQRDHFNGSGSPSQQIHFGHFVQSFVPQVTAISQNVHVVPLMLRANLHAWQDSEGMSSFGQVTIGIGRIVIGNRDKVEANFLRAFDKARRTERTIGDIGVQMQVDPLDEIYIFCYHNPKFEVDLFWHRQKSSMDFLK